MSQRVLESPEDVFFLVPHEVIGLLSTPHGLSAMELVRKRRADSTWTPAFSLVKGVLPDARAPMCHAAIIARGRGYRLCSIRCKAQPGSRPDKELRWMEMWARFTYYRKGR